MADLFPLVETDETGKVSLHWRNNGAGWCLSEGLLWGRDHWKKSFEVIATITPEIFHDIFVDVVEPRNSSDPMPVPFYNKPYLPETGSDTSVGGGFAANGDLMHRFYLATDLTPPSPTSRGRIHHYEWYAQAESDIDVLHVWWDIGAAIGCHSHPEGALYVPSWGEICFFGEKPSDCRIAGEARWTRPGFEYDYEGTGPEGTQIVVLNAHSGPKMCAAPSPFEI